eukprot:766973-Rhodomonas_salina.2
MSTDLGRPDTGTLRSSGYTAWGRANAAAAASLTSGPNRPKARDRQTDAPNDVCGAQSGSCSRVIQHDRCSEEASFRAVPHVHYLA